MNDREKMKLWVDCWKSAGIELEKLRRIELDKINVPQSIEALNDAFESAIFLHKPDQYSGLIEQQRFFQRMIDESPDFPCK